MNGRHALPLLALLGMVGAQAQASTMQVQAAGEVSQAGVLRLDGAPRLSDLVKAAKVRNDAYVLGAAWLRPSARPQQVRLKAGLLYELGSIGASARSDGRSVLADMAMRMRSWIAALPVTGRKPMSTLEPHALQVDRADNRSLREGDILYYPPRPTAVHVVGALVQDCELPHVGLRDARDYLSDCRLSPLADPDLLYVIEPDGKVFEQGIALWNRSPPMPVAPGAVLYVPLSQKLARIAATDTFNRDLAAFLATQPLPESDRQP